MIQMFLSRLVVTAFVLTSPSVINATMKMPNASSEYALREKLLTDYDRFVRPVLSPLTVVNVSFSLKFISLVNVIWNNPFLAWDPAKHDDIGQIRMSKDEIWVPDITLLNSANNPSLQTRHHYKSWVTVSSNGTNTWVSLAIYDSECQIKAQEFPFDKQKCFMDFASESYDAKSLDVHLLSGNHPERPDSRQISNGEWDISDIKTQSTKEKEDGRSTTFVHVRLNLTIQRIPTFYILYLLCPCAILSLLVFFSFIIPPENGERIGFCSSLLLALSVYLLLFSDLLPQNSRNVSLLGVIFVVIFLEAAFAVISTLIVLKVFHATREVPGIVKFLFLGQCSRKNKKIKPKNDVKRLESTLKEEPSLTITSEVSKTDLYSAPAKEEEKIAKGRELEVENQTQMEENQKSWLIVARKLDRLFFWFFFVFLSVSLATVVTFSKELNNIDIV